MTDIHSAHVHCLKGCPTGKIIVSERIVVQTHIRIDESRVGRSNTLEDIHLILALFLLRYFAIFLNGVHSSFSDKDIYVYD